VRTPERKSIYSRTAKKEEKKKEPTKTQEKSTIAQVKEIFRIARQKSSQGKKKKNLNSALKPSRCPQKKAQKKKEKGMLESRNLRSKGKKKRGGMKIGW